MQYSNYEYMPITEDIIPLCRETAASWVETHHAKKVSKMNWLLLTYYSIIGKH